MADPDSGALRREIASLTRANRALAAEGDRARELLTRTVRVTMVEGLAPVAEEILDGMMAVVGARRGFVGLQEGADWSFAAARNLARADIEDPASETSRTIIADVLRTGEPVISHDAGGDWETESVLALGLRSVACFPLRHGAETVGFVYLDDSGTHALFDDAAIAAVRSWLPVVDAAVARASTTAGVGVLPGVVSRSPRMLAILRELGRIANFDAPILLTGETGTGKSLIARQVHAASPRAKGPFIHVNCGAIPEALLEAELFGAEAGAYTGARVRRIGRFEAASGGTLFLDELDTLPVAAQVKLLVALQERSITRLGSQAPIPVDLRVIAAMSSEAVAAIAAGRLREDLYYRLAVFVARVPPLRERPEDIPLLARLTLERTATRYGLPPQRLSPEAERALAGHSWPGNVRELENALDRAALLSGGGVIEAIVLRPAPAPGGVGDSGGPEGSVAALRLAARRLADAMQSREDLRDLGIADAFAGALLLDLARRLGSREAAFRFLGREREVHARNHQRAWARDVGRLKSLAAKLGEPVPGE